MQLAKSKDYEVAEESHAYVASQISHLSPPELSAQILSKVTANNQGTQLRECGTTCDVNTFKGFRTSQSVRQYSKGRRGKLGSQDAVM